MNPSRIFILIILCVSLFDINAQLKFPKESQLASVTQRIGLTDITISYSRPAVKGREIWGRLVPYNEVWRAGANENTTITFSDPVSINGNKIEPGIYGLHMIPTENDWTIIISKQYTGWGSYAYDQREDLLRFKVKPETSPFREYLEFSFSNIKNNSTQLNLSWEELNVPFKIDVDVHSVVVNNFKKDLLGALQFQWLPFNQAANYCIQNKVYLEDAEKWIEKSIGMNKNFTNLNTKARFLELKGNKNEADQLKAAAMVLATEAEMNTYGYQLLAAKKIDEAIEIFKRNVKTYPNSWNVYDSLAEAYMTKGDNKLAKENYELALNKVNDEQNKNRIQKALDQLK